MSSKIKVDTIENVAGSGNVSLGSGHNLVVPGTLAITGASTLTGNVGIGNARTEGTLHVHSGSAGTVSASTQADDLVVENSVETGITIISPDDQSARIRFTSPSTNTDVGGATIFYRQNINKMNVGTAVAGGILDLQSGAGVSAINADANGRVTIPNQPSFAGAWNNNRTAGQILKGGDHQDHNVGNHYNNSTGLWTAPVTGKYFVSIMCMTTQAGGGTIDIELQKNGADYQMLVPYAQVSGNLHIHVAGSAIVHLAANDTLGWYINTGTIYGSSNGRHGNMSFRLLG